MESSFYCDKCTQILPGWAVPDDNAVIREFASAIGLVDAAGRPTKVGAALVLDFYSRLLTAAPALAARFPQDLVDASAALDGAGAKQRDRLLRAVLSVMSTFNPGDEQRMAALIAVLEEMALKHQRHGATIEEYAAVVSVLLGVLGDFARTSNVPHNIWLEAFEPALRRALTFASGRMMAAESAITAQPVEEPPTEVLERPETLEDSEALAQS
jgi:hemoglobin-like flavoprotein